MVHEVDVLGGHAIRQYNTKDLEDEGWGIVYCSLTRAWVEHQDKLGEEGE